MKQIKNKLIAVCSIMALLIAMSSFVALAEDDDYTVLSVASYDVTENARSSGGRFTVEMDGAFEKNDYSYGCDNMTVKKGHDVKLTAYPDNGYRFVGWYEGEYIRQDDEGNYIQAAEPFYDNEHLLSVDKVYTTQFDDYGVLCPVFEKAPLINFVDVGNIWTLLDPVNDIAFTGEINPNEEGLNQFITIEDEIWKNEGEQSIISMSDDFVSAPLAGSTYNYYVKISAKNGNKFDSENGFRFVYGGTEFAYEELNVQFSEDNNTAIISGFIQPQTIEPIDISQATVSEIIAKTYNGKAQVQNPVLEINVNGTDVVLEKDLDYKLSYKKNTDAGVATVIITGTGAFTNKVEKTFKINAKKITPTVTISKKAFVWNKKVQTPKVTIKYGNAKLPSSQYKITYSKGRKNVGIYSITVKMKGNYSGSKTVKYKINPKGTSLFSLKKANKAFTVKWNKQSNKMSSKYISGYQVQYSTNKNFKSGNKTIKVPGYRKTSKKISGLKNKTTYYVRVRTYMVVGKSTFYSGWSKSKSVKTPAPVKKVAAAASASGGFGTVYWTPNGSVYHLSRGCSTLSRSKTVYSGSIGESGKPRVCKVCGN